MIIVTGTYCCSHMKLFSQTTVSKVSGEVSNHARGILYASPILEYSSEPFPVKHSARPIPHRISDPNSGCVSRHKQYITTSWKDSVQTSCLRFPAGLSSSASTSTPTSRYGDPGRVYEKACAPKTGLQSQVLQRVRRIRPSRVIYP